MEDVCGALFLALGAGWFDGGRVVFCGGNGVAFLRERTRTGCERADEG
ncbi:hypothetical protein BN1095_6610002 [Clostridioides difficile]|uniref:Uncharacterized protein n=1 Tax=Clostridioides difficile TaxID=1496 RepID=A0A069B114_CLODI|nr:hypothetical protein BN1095_6610002 [Clostridioides difficile]